MAKSSHIERISALDSYFTNRPETEISTEIYFHLIKDTKITQIAIWPETISEFQNYINTQKITGDFLHPSTVCQIEDARFVRVEPLKWWLLNDENDVFQSLSEDIAVRLDLSHSFVQLKISGKKACSILSHHIPVDMRDAPFPINKLITTSLHHVGIKLWRAQDCWYIFMPRSFSESLWQLICKTAERYGYAPK
ncbi:MAG: hypothetical protein GWP24_03235 [Alphaproteobacteria bacterium]|nr:hypothetical protein [Alphaproteobacteria bacterium]